MSDIYLKYNWIIVQFGGNMYATKGVKTVKNVYDITPQQAPPQKKKRVAAYARVSSGKNAMLHSVKAQIDYYREYINCNPEWTFAGIYADEAKNGTKDSREQFQLLLEDCRAGKIDMIVTKAISKFARNTVDSLTTVRKLKDKGVEVYFEKENIFTLDSKGGTTHHHHVQPCPGRKPIHQ